MSTIEEITQIVENVYMSVLGRPADESGLAAWVARMNDPNDPLNTEDELIALFKLSIEYINLQQNETLPCSDIYNQISE
jgi:hypothetical protein